MNRRFVAGWFGSFVGLALFLILLSATSIGAAHGAAARTDGARDNDVSAVTQAPVTRQPSNPLLPVLGPATIITPGAAQDLAFAMGISPSDLISATLNGSDPRGVGIGTSPLGGFPTQGSTFAILSTGLASSADQPNSQGNLSFELAGLNNSEGNDLTQLALRLKVPANMNCLGVDFKFLSEEFPEFVGSSFNDTFTAELGGSNLIIANSVVTAPLNFAFDTAHHIISINTVFGVAPNTGTTYDGATPLLRARTPVTPSATVDIVFSVQDLGDSIYDSAVFLDKLAWTNESACVSGAKLPFPIYLPLIRR